MAIPYIDTPRTQVDGNATFMTNGLRSAGRQNLSALDSVENSFQSPGNDHDLVKTLDAGKKRKQPDFSLRTPRAGATPRPARNALHDRRNFSNAAPPKGEFTPMLNSVAKNNFARNNGTHRHNGPETPAALKEGYGNSEITPGLPHTDFTGMYEDESMEGTYQATPLPAAASSSVHSTPIAALPGQDGNNVVVGEGRKVMTLREQETAVDHLNKENFSLKLKIYYLEEAMKKMGPDINKVALQENATLKASEMTMQRELKRCQKSLHEAERNLEECQVQIGELRDKARRRQSDEEVQKELDGLRAELEDRDSQIRDLQEELNSARETDSDELQQLRDEIEELKFELREKDRVIEDKDEEIEALKEREGEDNAAAELEGKLEEANERIDELRDSLDKAQSEAHEARTEAEEAIDEKERAIADLQELQDDMANKSLYTKGLSRQLEEKASLMENDLNELRKEHASLKENFDEKTRQHDRLLERLRELEDDQLSERNKLQDELELAKHERSIANRERDQISAQLRQLEDDINSRENQKDILQNRHDALTTESASLVRDLEKARGTVAELEEQIHEERQKSLDTIRQIRSKHKNELESMDETIKSLRNEIEDKTAQHAEAQDNWDTARRSLEQQKDKYEREVASYKRTVEKLQDADRNVDGQESKLQNLVEIEKQRHTEEEELLNRQIKELNDDLASKRENVETQRQELLAVKEELRLSKREESNLRDKVQGLEDEVVILQASLEEEQQRVENQQRVGSSGLDRQLQTISRERQAARDQLASANIELRNAQTLCAELEAERDELRSQLDRFQNEVEGTHRLDQDKVALRKAKLRLEGEVNRLKDEKRSLIEAKDALQVDLDAEIDRAAAEENRLSAEIHQLQDNLFIYSEKRERELKSAKNKAHKLELRVHELEALLEKRGSADANVSTTSPDTSTLRRGLEDVRQKERAALQREADLKASVRQLKSLIIDLERENHELKTKEFDIESPNTSPASSKLQEEIRSLRKQLLDAQKTVRELKTRNHGLKQTDVKDGERKDLHELLKSSTLEAEALSVKLSERDARVHELKSHLRRVREERSAFMKKADAANHELENLQQRYETVIDEVSNNSDRKGRHAKELRGLGREIMWLRAKLAREEEFRKGLSWSKGLMDLAERVRVACNEADLKMIAEMGIKPPVAKPKFKPRRTFKAGIAVVVSIFRMQKMSAEWSKAKKLHEGLRKAKSDVVRRRECGRKADELHEPWVEV